MKMECRYAIIYCDDRFIDLHTMHHLLSTVYLPKLAIEKKVVPALPCLALSLYTSVYIFQKCQ